MSAGKAVALIAMGSTALVQALTSSHPDLASFVVQDPSFNAILGANASITLLHNATEPLFHEGAVYLAESDTLLVSSNRIELPEGQVDASTSNQVIKFSAVRGVSSSNPTVEPLSTADINNPNGGWLDPAFSSSSNSSSSSSAAVLWTAQGSKTTTAGIFTIPDPINAPNESYPLVTDFYGRPFNGPNDVATRPGDSPTTVWFTDPDYTYAQGLRDAPQLRNQVYRYEVASNTTRVVADGFEQPNGLAFTADGSILYITDASANTETPLNPQGTATIYAFDVVAAGGFLANRRVFAFAPVGLPDGIKVDADGNVWSGTGSGLVVWNAQGTLLGEVRIEGGSANFGFAEAEKTVFVLGETLLWKVQLG
ncbi:unnamed protein product [Discula destructiva]